MKNTDQLILKQPRL